MEQLNILETIHLFEKHWVRYWIRKNNLKDLLIFLSWIQAGMNEYDSTITYENEKYLLFLNSLWFGNSIEDIYKNILHQSENSEEKAYVYFYEKFHNFLQEHKIFFEILRNYNWYTNLEKYVNMSDDYKYGKKDYYYDSIKINTQNSCVLTTEWVFKTLYLYYVWRLSRKELYEWADFIEMNDSVDYEKFVDIIFSLANPEINGHITKKEAKKILCELDEVKFHFCIKHKNFLEIMKYIDTNYADSFFHGKSYYSLMAFDAGFMFYMRYLWVLFDRHKYFKFNNYIIQETFWYDYSKKNWFFSDKALLKFMNNDEILAYQKYFELLENFNDWINVWKYIHRSYKLGKVKSRK